MKGRTPTEQMLQRVKDATNSMHLEPVLLWLLTQTSSLTRESDNMCRVVSAVMRCGILDVSAQRNWWMRVLAYAFSYGEIPAGPCIEIIAARITAEGWYDMFSRLGSPKLGNARAGNVFTDAIRRGISRQLKYKSEEEILLLAFHECPYVAQTARLCLAARDPRYHTLLNSLQT